MEKLKQHITELGKFGAFFQELRLLIVSFSAIPLFLGILMQLVKLTQLGALSFFSWTQVINDSTSIGGLFLIYLMGAAGLSVWINPSKRVLYFHRWMVFVMGPIFVILGGSILSWWDISVSTFVRSLIVFVFLICSIFALYFLGTLYKEFHYKVGRFFRIKNQIYDLDIANNARDDIEKITLLHVLRSILVTGFLTVYYVSFSFLSGFFVYDYISRHYLVYFEVDHQLYLANYYNDKYIFSLGADRATVIIPLPQIKRLVTSEAGTDIYGGFTVDPIDDTRLQILGLTGSLNSNER